MTKKLSFAFGAILLAPAICGFTQDQTKSDTTPDQKTQAVREVKVTYGPSVQSLTDTTAFITWSTNVSADTVLRYGTSSDTLDKVAQSPSGGTTHSVKLQNLTPDTKYYYRIGTSAPQATEPMRGTASFTTKPAKPTH
jgi:phosphodiesterase/alkaline phosphatase D-like protein